MTKLSFAVGLSAAGAVCASAAGVTVTNNPVADRPTLTAGFAELDMSAYAVQNGFSGLSGPNNNTFETSFVLNSPSGQNFSGSLRAEVFGNQGTTGPGLTDVIIVYTMTGNGFDNGANFSTIDAFTLGLNSGAEIDFGYLTSATHGRVTAESTPGQADPQVDVFDNSGSNDTFRFDFNLGGLGDGLGAFDGDEMYTWYVRGDASVAVNVVDVTVADAGSLTTQTLGFVNIQGQPDLDVPAPGALALAGIGFGALARRRRA